VTRPAPSWFRVLSWLAVCGWSNAVVFLSSLSGPEVEEVMPFQIWDKFLHGFSFLVGGMLLGIALRGVTDWSARKLAIVGWTILLTFGAADELHQLLVPHRSGADPGDWFADVLGAALGLGAALIYARYTREHRTAPAAA
jgi:VanZ family protein